MNLPPPSTVCGKECGNCGLKKAWVLHHIRLRGIYRRLCTSCVLRLHPESFCPSCLHFYDSHPPHPSRRVACSNCSSFTHTPCVKSFPMSQSPYICPPCADSGFSFFDATDHVIDKRLALALLCAARIASASMSKAVVVARTEADKRVKDAVNAKKKAREALEHVVSLEKEMHKKKEQQLLRNQQQQAMKIDAKNENTVKKDDDGSSTDATCVHNDQNATAKGHHVKQKSGK